MLVAKHCLHACNPPLAGSDWHYSHVDGSQQQSSVPNCIGGQVFYNHIHCTMVWSDFWSSWWMRAYSASCMNRIKLEIFQQTIVPAVHCQTERATTKDKCPGHKWGKGSDHVNRERGQKSEADGKVTVGSLVSANTCALHGPALTIWLSAKVCSWWGCWLPAHL